MATAKFSKEVSTTHVTPQKFILELDTNEMSTLKAILARIGGDPQKSSRLYADRIERVICDFEVEDFSGRVSPQPDMRAIYFEK